jgi:hypothetical protein
MRHHAFLPLALLLLVPVLGCRSKPPDLKVRIQSGGADNDKRRWMISHGVTEGRLAFVVFDGGPKTDSALKCSVVMRSNGNGEGVTTAEFTRPDGTKVQLPTDVQLMEVVDGQYLDTTRRVTLEDFEAFMDSNPASYTIENLLQFVDGKHKR